MPIIISFLPHTDSRATHTSLVTDLSYFASRNPDANVLLLDTQMQCGITDRMMGKLFYSYAASQVFSPELFKQHGLQLTQASSVFEAIASSRAVVSETAESLKETTRKWLTQNQGIMRQFFGSDSIDTVWQKIDRNDPSIHSIVINALVQIIKRPIRLIVGHNAPDFFNDATQQGIMPVTICYNPDSAAYFAVHLVQPQENITEDIALRDITLGKMLRRLLPDGKKIFHAQHIITVKTSDSTRYISYSIQGLLEFLRSTVSKAEIECVIEKFAEKMRMFNANANAGRENTGALFVLPGSQFLTDAPELDKSPQILVGFRLLMEKLNVHMTFIDLSRTPEDLREVLFMGSDYFVAPCVPHADSKHVLHELLTFSIPRWRDRFDTVLTLQKNRPHFLGWILAQIESAKKASGAHADHPQPGIDKETLDDFTKIAAAYNKGTNVTAFCLEVRHFAGHQKMLDQLLKYITDSLPLEDRKQLPASLRPLSDCYDAESMQETTQAAQNLIDLLTSPPRLSPPTPVSFSPSPQETMPAQARRIFSMPSSASYAAASSLVETFVDTADDLCYEAQRDGQTRYFSRELPSTRRRAGLCSYLGMDDSAFLAGIRQICFNVNDPNNTIIWDLLMDISFALFIQDHFRGEETPMKCYQTAQENCVAWLKKFKPPAQFPFKKKDKNANKLTEILGALETFLVQNKNEELAGHTAALKALLAVREQAFLQVKEWLAGHPDIIVQYIAGLEMCPLNTLVEYLKSTARYSVCVWIEPHSDQKLRLHFQSIVHNPIKTLNLLFVVSRNSYGVIEDTTPSLSHSYRTRKRVAMAESLLSGTQNDHNQAKAPCLVNAGSNIAMDEDPVAQQPGQSMSMTP